MLNTYSIIWIICRHLFLVHSDSSSDRFSAKRCNIYWCSRWCDANSVTGPWLYTHLSDIPVLAHGRNTESFKLIHGLRTTTWDCTHQLNFSFDSGLVVQTFTKCLLQLHGQGWHGRCYRRTTRYIREVLKMFP